MSDKDHIELSKKLIQALRYSPNDDENAAALSRTVRAAIADAYEDAAKIAEIRISGLDMPADDIASAIRAKAKEITHT
jgi:hypothetical protein